MAHNTQSHHVSKLATSVSLMVAKIWQIENFEGQFDRDPICQYHPKYDK